MKKTPGLGEGQEEGRKHVKRLYFNALQPAFSSPTEYGLHMIWMQKNSSLLHANQAEHVCNSGGSPIQPELGDANTAAFPHQRYREGFQLSHNISLCHKPSNSWNRGGSDQPGERGWSKADFPWPRPLPDLIWGHLLSPSSAQPQEVPHAGHWQLARSKWGCFALPFNSTYFGMKRVRTYHWGEVQYSLVAKAQGPGIRAPIAPCSMPTCPSPICAPSLQCLGPHKALLLIWVAKGHSQLMHNVVPSFSPEESVKTWQICTNFRLTLGYH